MKDPSRDLPRVIHFAMPTVLCCYILINMAYYVVIPWNELSASKAIAVVRTRFSVDQIFSHPTDKIFPGQVVGNKTLGPFAGLIFAILISISVLGVMNIETYTGGILTETAARHGYMPRLLARSVNDDNINDEDANAHEDADSTLVQARMSQYMGQGLRAHLTSTPV